MIPRSVTLPYRHLVGDHLLVPCSECGGELTRVRRPSGSGPEWKRPKHIICSGCAHDYGEDTTEMLVEGGKA